MKNQPGHAVMLTGTGSFLPGAPIPYDDADRVLGEFDQVDPAFRTWYMRARRTMKTLLGIQHYFYALDPVTRAATETPSSLAAKAGARAMEAAGVGPEDIDIVFYAGATQDHFVTPPTSTLVQQHLGIERCAEMSIHSNCTSTYKAIQVAADQIAYGRYKTALVTSANLVSVSNLASAFNQAHLTRAQAMMRFFLCDGGGAIVLQRGEDGQAGLRVVDTFVESLGTKHAPHMSAPFGSADNPIEAVAQGRHHISQDFGEVSRIAPAFFVDGFLRFATQLGLDWTDEAAMAPIRHVLVNVPSDHLVDAGLEDAALRTKLPMDGIKKRYTSTVRDRGYTGPAAVLITLDELLRAEDPAGGPLRPGEAIMSVVTESSKWMNAGFLFQVQAASP